MQQHDSSSGTTAAVLQALVFVPVVTVYVCVVGAQQEIEPRHHRHVKCRNQPHVSSGLIQGIRSIQQEQQKQYNSSYHTSYI